MKRLAYLLLLCAVPCLAQQTAGAVHHLYVERMSIQPPCKPSLQMVGGEREIVPCKGDAKIVPDQVAHSSDTQLSALQKKEEEAELNYLIYQWHHTRNVFVWQYWSGIVIFVVSVLLVVAGIIFAAWQLQYSMRLGSKRMEVMDAHAAALTAAAAAGDGAAATAVASEPSGTTLKISATGLEVHSATLGVIILAFSMGFFYMYLKYVYPIQLVQTQPVTQSQR
ncbi:MULTISPECIES: hypothetical protein [Acidobacterium]|nr:MULTISPECIES: hypothetical protein [Acidobacterium]HCT62093.1 hypothetical protein [Acidobacterium sp.]